MCTQFKESSGKANDDGSSCCFCQVQYKLKIVFSNTAGGDNMSLSALGVLALSSF